MQFKQETILSLFDRSQRTYIIPVYQRAYAWEKDQWKSFYEDLRDQACNENNYFYGNILLETIKKEKEYEIIDGQQRLTTLTIFMRSLFNTLTNRKDNEGIKDLDFDEKEKIYFIVNGNKKLRPVDYDRGFYDAVIIENKNTCATSTSQKRLLSAKHYFEDLLNKESTDLLLKMLNKIEDTEITSIELDGKKDSALMFELQNNRGKNLTNMERLKSYFMYQMYVYSNPDEIESNVTYISDLYKSIYLTVNDLKKIDEDSVLYYHSQAYVKGYSYRTIEDIKEMLKKSKNKISYIKEFTLELKNSFDAIKKFENSTLENAKKLKSMQPTVFVYPFIIKGYKYLTDSKDLDRLFKILEVIVYRDNISNTRADIYGRINQIMKDYEGDNKKLISHLERKFNEENYWSYSRMKEALNGYMYSNPTINYTLWEYEKSIQNKGYIIENVNIKDESIEHISPQTPPGIQIESGYDVDSNNQYTEAFIEKELNCIGNLMIISQSHNSSIGNKPFRNKIESYNKNPLLNQQAEIKEFLVNNKLEWKTESIENRKKKIVDFSLNNWDFRNV